MKIVPLKVFLFPLEKMPKKEMMKNEKKKEKNQEKIKKRKERKKKTTMIIGKFNSFPLVVGRTL